MCAKTPGRQFPGCVIQGDSLSILVKTAQEILQRVKDSGNEELVGCASELVDSLQSRQEHYERVLAQHSIPLPYPK